MEARLFANSDISISYRIWSKWSANKTLDSFTMNIFKDLQSTSEQKKTQSVGKALFIFVCCK